MKKYCLPEIPSIYWLHLIKYECKKCKKEFQLNIAKENDGIVQFESQISGEPRWLPMYGDGGYLYLFTKLVPNYVGKMIPKIVNKFIEELNKFIEKKLDEEYFQLVINKHECPYCQSKDIKEISEEVLTNPDLDWLRISCELFESKSY